MTTKQTSSAYTAGALAAYRRDIAALGVERAFGPDDGLWLKAAYLLERAGDSKREVREPMLAALRDLVRTLIGPELWERGPRLDPTRPTTEHTLEGRVRCLAELAEDAGALSFAEALLIAFLDAEQEMTELEQGRVLAHRARLAWKRGETELARARYQEVTRVGRRSGSPELRVRALIGYAVLARLRGNYPASRTYATRAVNIAIHENLLRLGAVAHHALMVVAAKAEDFDNAVQHGWQSFLSASGDPQMEVDVLGNLGQLFLDAGHPRTAMLAFKAVLARQPAPRVLVPALGGMALAAARSGRADVFQDLARRAEALAGTHPYDDATLALDLARAATIAGLTADANHQAARVLTLATRYGYHELEHWANHTAMQAPVAPAVRALPLRTEQVAEALHALVSA